MALAKLLLVLSPSQGAKGHREWLSGLFPCLRCWPPRAWERRQPLRPEILHNCQACMVSWPHWAEFPRKTQGLKVGMVALNQGPVGQTAMFWWSGLCMEWGRAEQREKMDWLYPHHWRWQPGSCGLHLGRLLYLPKSLLLWRHGAGVVTLFKALGA